MLFWIVIIAGLIGSWHWTDLASQQMFSGVVAPVGFMILAIAALVRAVLWLGPKSAASASGGEFIGSPGGIGGGGDCGGDGGGC